MAHSFSDPRDPAVLEPFVLCQSCGGALKYDPATGALVCRACGEPVAIVEGKPAFTAVPDTIRATEFRQRGEGQGTPWRQANWAFLEREIAGLAADAVVLDVGAGRGDFAQITRQRNSLALDIYPYPEVDLVCDLTQVNPFRDEQFDAVVLMNVLEHVFDTRAFLKELARVLKPGGLLLAAVPFLLKEHQGPFDFVRYTQYSLRRWGEESGLEVVSLEGYYDPMFLLEQGSSNLKHTVIPGMPRLKNYLSRVLLGGHKLFAAALAALVGKGYTRQPLEEPSPAPIGYHVVYRKG